MSRLSVLLFLFFTPHVLHAQDIITEAETSRIINILASDSLKGRGNGQPAQAMAAQFVRDEFAKAGLKTMYDSGDYYFPFTITIKGSKITLYNVVAVLPGKSKPEEIVVFSAHYDHIGIIRNKKDSILNGANDNASGTTALLMLAKYFAARNDNERTLLFCAFSGEELGLMGSKDFVARIDPQKIIAGVNIEMIGIPQFGEKAIFITGSNQSSFDNIIRKNLSRDDIRIVPEPDPEKNLFRRSDNYSFVKKGVVAHSIMASDDADKCYHRTCDETRRIDIPNMTAIIKAIAKGTSTLVNGEDTPEKK
jgi:Zn-dependent M28 family amino/carboxypeptidase